MAFGCRTRPIGSPQLTSQRSSCGRPDGRWVLRPEDGASDSRVGARKGGLPPSDGAMLGVSLGPTRVNSG